MIVSIEACIDICYHFISKNRFRVPEDYADTFRVMEEVGIFDREFVKMARRNGEVQDRLVHIYWDCM
ncbi:MAG: HepT-like ribonuclease domain-containing protein [Candidatus Jordarchaeaceae archaeon]